MICKECGCHFHEDHGCGTAVLCGSSYAEHSLRCSPWLKSIGPVFKTDEPYLPWEAPAGECPVCWHKDKPEVKIKMTEKFSKKIYGS